MYDEREKEGKRKAIDHTIVPFIECLHCHWWQSGNHQLELRPACLSHIEERDPFLLCDPLILESIGGERTLGK
jgi:hypothetical protein